MKAKSILTGRIVTMDARSTVHDPGALYVEGGRIVAVRDVGAPRPAGFENVGTVATGGTIFPGLIELHNHLGYNALPLWKVPKKYNDRDQWGRELEYARLVTGPMHVIGRSDAMPAVARYVEVKCLVAGVTTTQGITLASNQGARRFYEGLIRNVEQTSDPSLPQATTRIPDVDARSWAAFMEQVQGEKQLLLHLAEGQGAPAREHFLALEQGGEWAITPRLVGIHCAALDRSDFDVMAARGGAMVWSPLSNLLLYGGTADVEAARAAGVRIALGSDWSPTGSKNLLCELKVARHVAPASFTDRDLVAMVTRDAAKLAAWDSEIGSLEQGRRADVVVIAGAAGDPYRQLINATESDVHLVLLDGIGRIGSAALMKKIGATGERIVLDGSQRTVNLSDPTADELVAGLSLADAMGRLSTAMKRLPKLAAEQEEEAKRPRAAAAEPAWRLALDETEPSGVEVRPRLGEQAGAAGPVVLSPLALKVPLSDLLGPMTLDPLTVVEDGSYLELLAGQANLPAGLGAAIAAYY